MREYRGIQSKETRGGGHVGGRKRGRRHERELLRPDPLLWLPFLSISLIYFPFLLFSLFSSHFLFLSFLSPTYSIVSTCLLFPLLKHIFLPLLWSPSLTVTPCLLLYTPSSLFVSFHLFATFMSHFLFFYHMFSLCPIPFPLLFPSLSSSLISFLLTSPVILSYPFIFCFLYFSSLLLIFSFLSSLSLLLCLLYFSFLQSFRLSMFISSPFSFPFSFPLFILLCLRVFVPPLGPSSLLLLPLLWFSFLSTTSVPFCSLSFHLDSSHLASSHFLFFLVSCFVLSSHPFVLLIYFSLISFLSSHLFQCYVSSPYVSLVYFAFFPPPHLMSTHLLFLISLCLFSLSYLLSCNSFPFSRQEFSHQLYSPLLHILSLMFSL